MAHIRNSGRIPDTYIDRSIYDLSFKVVSPVSWSAKDILTILDGVIDVSDISDIWKSDFSWNVTVTSQEAARILSEIGTIRYKDIDVKLECFSKQNIKIKIHWLPPYVKDDFLRAYFARYGIVKSVEREARVISAEATKRSGTRIVSLVTDRDKASEIPHLNTFEGGITMLITITGRAPLCLKCRNLGHVRKDCPLNRKADTAPTPPSTVQGTLTYSSVVNPIPVNPSQPVTQDQENDVNDVSVEDNVKGDVPDAQEDVSDPNDDMEATSQTIKRKSTEDFVPTENPEGDPDGFTEVRSGKSARKKTK